jgi:hypothetical protein
MKRVAKASHAEKSVAPAMMPAMEKSIVLATVRARKDGAMVHPSLMLLPGACMRMILHSWYRRAGLGMILVRAVGITKSLYKTNLFT